jgi:predicted nuclease of predicted toxin-antitoxin system
VADYILGANLSPRTAQYLADVFGIDILSLIAANWGDLADEKVVNLAKQQHRVIITLDTDFGEIYYRHERGNIGVILLRLEDESRHAVEEVLGRFFRQAAEEIDLEHSLVVLTESTMRIVRP